MTTSESHKDRHLKRDVWCNECKWIGITGELIISHPCPELLCPKCRGSDIHQPVADAPTGIQ